MEKFLALRMFTRFGPIFAVLIVLGTWAATLCAAWHSLVAWPGIIIGGVAGLLLGFFFMVLVDLTRILSEMLLPR